MGFCKHLPKAFSVDAIVCFLKSTKFTKKFAQGHQKWWNQRDATLQASAENFRLCGKNKYFFIETKVNCFCLICNESVAVMKEHSVRKHCETKHQTFTSYTGVEREEKVKQMTASLLTQQWFFFRANKAQEKCNNNRLWSGSTHCPALETFLRRCPQQIVPH